MNSYTLKRIATVVGLSLGGFALAAAASTTWTPPTAPPPGNNVDAPINVGSSLQSKMGRMRLNTAVPGDVYGLDVFGISRFFGNIEVGAPTAPATLKITDGMQAAGKVFTSDAAGVGHWATSSLPAGLTVKVITGPTSASRGDPSVAGCPAGYALTGGGFTLYNDPGDLSPDNRHYILYNAPLDFNSVPPTQWVAKQQDAKVNAYAICVRLQ